MQAFACRAAASRVRRVSDCYVVGDSVPLDFCAIPAGPSKRVAPWDCWQCRRYTSDDDGVLSDHDFAMLVCRSVIKRINQAAGLETYSCAQRVTNPTTHACSSIRVSMPQQCSCALEMIGLVRRAASVWAAFCSSDRRAVSICPCRYYS